MQTLELIFSKEDGKTVVFSLDNPVTPVNEQTISQVMDTILASSIFLSLGENAQKKGARLVEKIVTEVNIAP
ncbi:DUF2922 domain-containing protein [Bacillus cytotoxicus]|uniref:DUF2922 domain-containing protein n=1 Tax=Bacillus cytotoxicus TaxID=580165 RepID=UPI00086439CF|nr:DUF2922 domain-containing protein [Bacillus cytotoxicus]AWC30537.1 DUF2922 domain-containing protein [Bacillus cytotoxicus]AWC42680.1 DUF2922 domain-containing protein [Bacillus cytotoxicus]AWC50611.1 DUF2922 domain-containing protein [Bacillus cytotoxicus]AWC54665.1 DUF2922 domain-containing protein [Bacillus cytotoxicus]AWC58788.1 DUF2922 domain-containing protein [Bacillus cytotoxicus]